MKEERKEDMVNKRKKDVFNFQVNTNLNILNPAPLAQTNNNNINLVTFPTETGYVA